MLDELKYRDKKEFDSFGVGFLVEPAMDVDVENCKRRVLDLFGLNLSSDYISILSISDGFSCNGFNLYGSKLRCEPYFIEGILDINVEFWGEPSLRKYFAYSQESTTRIVFNMDSGKYEIVDRVSWDELYSFLTLNEALIFNLEDCAIF